jgi:hypothetical protein
LFIWKAWARSGACMDEFTMGYSLTVSLSTCMNSRGRGTNNKVAFREEGRLDMMGRDCG